MTHKIKHIAVAVKDIESASKTFALLGGASISQITEVPDQKLRICFVHCGDTSIELIQPTSGNVGVTKFLEKRGEGLHHICLEVEDLGSAITRFTAQGFRFVDETPRIGAEGHRIAFMHPQSTNGVLIELEETGEKLPEDQISH